MKERLTAYQRSERIYGLLFDKKPKRRPFNFEIHLNDECNLSCRGCFHFAPLVRGHAPYPIDEFESDMRRISAIFKGRFGWVHLLGGEPLLNKDVAQYLDIVGRYVRIYNEAFGQTFDTKDDWIALEGHTKKEILDFLRTPNSFCKYCDLEKRLDEPVPWSPSKKEKDEWLR